MTSSVTATVEDVLSPPPQWRTQEFCSGGGVQQIHLRIQDRDLGAAAP